MQKESTLTRKTIAGAVAIAAAAVAGFALGRRRASEAPRGEEPDPVLSILLNERTTRTAETLVLSDLKRNGRSPSFKAGHRLTYGVDEDGDAVEVPLTNIVVTGGTGSGATVTMSSLVASAIRQNWSVALATPKYQFAGGDFPGATDSDNVDMMFYRESDDFHDEALALAMWVDHVPTGSPERPRLVILDSLQSMISGNELATKRFLGAVGRLLDDPNTAVVMRAQVLTIRDFPDLLRQSVGAAISMGRVPSAQARSILEVVDGDFDLDDVGTLTEAGIEWPRGRGVLVTPGRTEVTHTPWIESIVPEA